MHAKKIFIHYRADRKEIKSVGDPCPGLHRPILFLNLIVETILFRDESTFMISSKESYFLWVFDLIGKEDANCLSTIVASVDIIPQE